jgi:hypothetical protein
MDARQRPATTPCLTRPSRCLARTPPLHPGPSPLHPGPPPRPTTAPQAPPKAVVLDIEGTVAPISYVADVMFPYARERAQQHLAGSYGSEDTQASACVCVGGGMRGGGGWAGDEQRCCWRKDVEQCWRVRACACRRSLETRAGAAGTHLQAGQARRQERTRLPLASWLAGWPAGWLARYVAPAAAPFHPACRRTLS